MWSSTVISSKATEIILRWLSLDYMVRLVLKIFWFLFTAYIMHISVEFSWKEFSIRSRYTIAYSVCHTLPWMKMLHKLNNIGYSEYISLTMIPFGVVSNRFPSNSIEFHRISIEKEEKSNNIGRVWAIVTSNAHSAGQCADKQDEHILFIGQAATVWLATNPSKQSENKKSIHQSKLFL